MPAINGTISIFVTAAFTFLLFSGEAADAKKTIHIEKLHCTTTSESLGDDEIYIDVNVTSNGKTKKYRIPTASEKDLNNGDTYKINKDFTGDEISITVMEQDDLSPDDKIGSLSISDTTPNGQDESKHMTGDTGDYHLYYDVSDNFSYPFNMVIMSDPQFYYCDSTACQNGPGSSLKANEWHADAIEEIESSAPNFRGVIINGDLTHLMDEDQLDDFAKYYAERFKIYPGLGNHDYENYTPARDDTKACDWIVDGCLFRMLQYFGDYIQEHVTTEGYGSNEIDLKQTGMGWEGSWSYYWDVGDIRFVQLNNHPAYQWNFTVELKPLTVKQSFDWLESVLDEAKADNKIVFLNFHGLNQTDSLSPYANEKVLGKEQAATNRAGYVTFQKLLDGHDEVKGIFVGHIHELIGESGDIETMPKRRNIPVFYSGSAEYNHLLLVEFDSNKATVKAIDTTDGKATPLSGYADYVINY